jgi:hypothetical protein
MTEIQKFSKADIDRLLGLADQFLDDWAEDAVQSGQRDPNYEERSSEWAAVRPLLLAVPELLRGLKGIVALCDGSPDPTARCCFSIARTSLDSLSLSSAPSA